MARSTYSAKSPYAVTTQNSKYLEYYVHRPIPSDSTDQEITITHEFKNRPDLLAKRLYGTERLWWIFAVRNMDALKDPIRDLVPGMKIWVPTSERLFRLVQ